MRDEPKGKNIKMGDSTKVIEKALATILPLAT